MSVSGKVREFAASNEESLLSVFQRSQSAQRLKKVFQIDIERYAHCGGRVKIISSGEDPW
jgi:hypothetical protein